MAIEDFGRRPFSVYFRQLFANAAIAASKAAASAAGSPWMWTLAFGHHEDRTPTHGYKPTREAAMAAFAKSWRRE